MNFKRDEINTVEDYWKNTSQDLDFIALETEIPRDTVIGILNLLSDQGKIKDFQINENKVLLFEELIDIDDYFELDLDKISTKFTDKDYFFDNEEINKEFNKGSLTINVKSKHFHHDYIILKLEVTYLDETYPISLLYDRTDSVYLMSTEQSDLLDKLYEELGHNLAYFLNFSQEILDKIIPLDFWETKAKFN